MVIFYHKNTKEIIASFPEAYSLNPKVTITREGEDASMFKQFTLSPDESLPFENPFSHINIHDHIVVEDSHGKVIGLKRIRPIKVDKTG